jgi:parallel beta-helix repeat protein
MNTYWKHAASVALMSLALAAPATAQVAINQAKAKAGLGGCDAPGYPVTICKPGPYKLTGPLMATVPHQNLIEIESNVVTIDLNGYYVGGNCSLGPTIAYGISTKGGRTQVTVINGVVSCMAWGIILQGDSHRVERVTAVLNSHVGIRAGSHSIVKDNQANSNGTGLVGAGIECGEGCVISGNTANHNSYGIIADRASIITNNTASNNGSLGLFGRGFGYGSNVLNSNLEGAVFAVGSTDMGGNVCGAALCQ